VELNLYWLVSCLRSISLLTICFCVLGFRGQWGSYLTDLVDFELQEWKGCLLVWFPSSSCLKKKIKTLIPVPKIRSSLDFGLSLTGIETCDSNPPNPKYPTQHSYIYLLAYCNWFKTGMTLELPQVPLPDWYWYKASCCTNSYQTGKVLCN
jgi:hypothetical protein